MSVKPDFASLQHLPVSILGHKNIHLLHRSRDRGTRSSTTHRVLTRIETWPISSTMSGNMQMRRICLRISPACQTIKSDHDDQSALTARVFCAQIRAAVAPEHVPLPRMRSTIFNLDTWRAYALGVYGKSACLSVPILSRGQWCLCLSPNMPHR